MATYRAFLNTTTLLVSKDRPTLGTLKPSSAIARKLFKGSLEVVKNGRQSDISHRFIAKINLLLKWIELQYRKIDLCCKKIDLHCTKC